MSRVCIKQKVLDTILFIGRNRKKYFICIYCISRVYSRMYRFLWLAATCLSDGGFPTFHGSDG